MCPGGGGGGGGGDALHYLTMCPGGGGGGTLHYLTMCPGGGGGGGDALHYLYKWFQVQFGISI